MDYVEISNSMIVYLLCGITVAIALSRLFFISEWQRK